ncbi:sodium:proton antiporter NhaD [Fulvivirga sediminis]|uniref:Sodium:proton antiporter NhaD n=1 Tax=Fulvivirga sediminis TaxID=2803949 RepID=A0A937K190_9BACT|nr:sodium:proton antiporter NhaD [Fulvivirga sediminis]MBL3657100.1 sodium:proton antiporter NhaD [Fulvivirga sediminis]
MVVYLISVFIFGYLLITLEEVVKINKTAIALYMGVVTWVVFVLGSDHIDGISESLTLQLGSVSEILFFLMGAMTIIELIDIHQGFNVITNRIKTSNRRTLLWMIVGIAFFLSALLDNLTCSIVMISLLRKLIKNKDDMNIYAGALIIAANAGGAWSPIGDVTTTMLWIGGQISSVAIMKSLFIPSVICTVIPTYILSRSLKGELDRKHTDEEKALRKEKIKGSWRMLIGGLLALIFVPIFKGVTHLPPYMGMLLGLSLVWILSELIHFKKDEHEKKPYSAVYALSKIDASSVLFFLGILMAVGALEHAGILEDLALWMNHTIGNIDAIVFIMGILSSIVDNVPLVAATMGMYPISQFPMDHQLWEFTAFCAGTGGSLLIVGSAAGVAVMGMAKIKFFWYLKKITLPAFIGYLAGAAYYLIEVLYF